MALIKGKQIQDTSVSLTKLSDAGAVTLSTGTITLSSAARMQISADPVNGSDVVRKAYVDSVATGLDVKKSVSAIYRDTPVNGQIPVNTSGGVPLTINALIDGIAGIAPLDQPVFDGYAIQEGDRVLIAYGPSSARQKINGIWVWAGNRFSRATDADNITPNTGEVSGGLFTFVEQGTIFADTGWVLSSPNGAITDIYNPDIPGAIGYTTELVFTQFSYAGVVEAGTGLSRSGTVFNVNYDDSSIGINGSDQLYIKNGGVTNAMLVNSTHTFAGDTGTGTVALGSTLTIAGGTNGIDTVYSSGTLTINLDLSELTTVTTIADADFIAISSSGAVNQKITFANLKTLIGAASQLNISAEGATATSFDLDTDTLNFATGAGLTFVATGSAAPGTTNTLTLTVSNNPIHFQVFTGLTAAANATINVNTTNQVAEVFSVTINGVALKFMSQWELDAGNELALYSIPYAIETTDEIEITYRQA